MALASLTRLRAVQINAHSACLARLLALGSVTQIPPASANASRRAATLLPSHASALNDIANVASHPEFNPSIWRHLRIAEGHRLLSLRSGHVFFKLGLSELSVPLLEGASRHSRRLPPRAGPTRGRAIEAAARAHPP